MVSGVNYKEMQRVFVVTLAVNIILAAAKLVVGIIYGSAAVVSDSVHTLSIVATTLIAMVGLKLSKAPADKGHNYGHENRGGVFDAACRNIVCHRGAVVV